MSKLKALLLVTANARSAFDQQLNYGKTDGWVQNIIIIAIINNNLAGHPLNQTLRTVRNVQCYLASFGICDRAEFCYRQGYLKLRETICTVTKTGLEITILDYVQIVSAGTYGNPNATIEEWGVW